MEELYVEGLATHGDPESCVDDPRGRGEALTGARAGRDIEPRNRNDRGADGEFNPTPPARIPEPLDLALRPDGGQSGF